MKAFLLLFLTLPAYAQIDDVTLTGTATPIPNGVTSGPVVPFTASFTVDTQSGTQSFQFCGVNLCGFSATGMNVSNIQGTVNGVPQDMGSGGGGGGSGPENEVFGGMRAGNLLWEFDEPTFGVSPNMNSILMAAPADDAGQSTLNGYSLSVNTISIIDPPAMSIPEPSTWNLMLLALLTLIAVRLIGAIIWWRRLLQGARLRD